MQTTRVRAILHGLTWQLLQFSAVPNLSIVIFLGQIVFSLKLFLPFQPLLLLKVMLEALWQVHVLQVNHDFVQLVEKDFFDQASKQPGLWVPPNSMLVAHYALCRFWKRLKDVDKEDDFKLIGKWKASGEILLYHQKLGVGQLHQVACSEIVGVRSKSCCHKRWQRWLSLHLPLRYHLVALKFFHFRLDPVGLHIEFVVVVLEGVVKRVGRIVGEELAKDLPDGHIDDIIARASLVPVENRCCQWPVQELAFWVKYLLNLCAFGLALLRLWSGASLFRLFPLLRSTWGHWSIWMQLQLANR